MKQTFLEFEKPIAEIEAQIEALLVAHDLAPDGTASDPADEIAALRRQSAAATRQVYTKLSPWQISQVSRHPQRPY